MINEFQQELLKEDLAQNTISSYMLSVKQYLNFFDEFNSKNLLTYKGYLIERYKPKTINLQITGINKYLSFIGKDSLRLKSVKMQRKNFLQNVISYPDYLYFLNCLKNDDNMLWYFVVRFLGATGARVSELVKFKVEHVKVGYVDLYTKGGKIRRIYFPANLRQDALKWLKEINKNTGYLFVNRFGNQITTRGLAHQLKAHASKYDLDLDKIYPHSFRHMFAKKFLEEREDLALLSDLMGHDSIETTKIYLTRTSEEQHEIVNNIVVW